MDKIDRRCGYTNHEIRAEAKPENKSLVIRGYAILYETPTTIYDKRDGVFTEVIKRGALDNTDLSDVYLLYGHNYDKVLGHTRANLRLESDDVGLFYECELPNTRDARDVFNLVEARQYLGQENAGSIVDGNSFGFYSSDKIVNDIREVRHIDLLDEISIVPRPAYDLACSTAVRQSNAQNVEHQQSAENNADTNVEHQQDEEALRMAQALDEKLKKLEEL